MNKKGTNVYEDTNTRFTWFDEKDVKQNALLVSLAQQRDSLSASRLFSLYQTHKRGDMVLGVPSGDLGNRLGIIIVALTKKT